MGRHDTYGSALTAQPGESQRRPATNASSQLIEYIGLPALRAPGASVPDGRTIRRHHQDRSRTSAPPILIPVTNLTSFAQVQAASSFDAGRGGTVITYDGGSVFVGFVTPGQLTADDVSFL